MVHGALERLKLQLSKVHCNNVTDEKSSSPRKSNEKKVITFEIRSDKRLIRKLVCTKKEENRKIITEQIQNAPATDAEYS